MDSRTVRFPAGEHLETTYLSASGKKYIITYKFAAGIHILYLVGENFTLQKIAAAKSYDNLYAKAF